MRTTGAVCAILSAIFLASCGGPSTTSTLFESGNWALEANSSTTPGQTTELGGNLAQSGDQVTGTMCYSLGGVQCPGTTLHLAGAATGTTAVLTASMPDGSVITLNLTWSSPTSTGGSYQIERDSATVDQGAISGNLVPSLSGNWSGNNTGINGITLSATITQAGASTTDGSFQLTLSNIVLSGPTCYTAATTGTGTLAGENVQINFDLHDSSSNIGHFGLGAKISSPATATAMDGSYVADFSGCGLDVGQLTLTKQ